MTVVIDTNVFLAAAFWKGGARKCWALCAGRHYPIAVTADILHEYRNKAQALPAGQPGALSALDRKRVSPICPDPAGQTAEP